MSYEPTAADVIEDFEERCAIMATTLDPSVPIPEFILRRAWRLMRLRYGDALCALARLLG